MRGLTAVCIGMVAPLFMIAALVAGPLSAAGEAAGIEAVRCAEIAFSRSVETRDKNRFAAFLDDDARFVGRTVLRGREEILRGWAVFFGEDGPQLSWRPEFVEVLSDSKLALTRGPYMLTTTDEAGERVQSWGIFNSVWRLDHDGDWKVVFDAGHEGAGEMSDEHRNLLSVATCDRAVGERSRAGSATAPGLGSIIVIPGAAVREST